MSRVINVDPDILGGTPCFAGTRVPVVSLFDYIVAGYSIFYFLEQFPSVNRDQVLLLIDDFQEKLLATE